MERRGLRKRPRFEQVTPIGCEAARTRDGGESQIPPPLHPLCCARTGDACVLLSADHQRTRSECHQPDSDSGLAWPHVEYLCSENGAALMKTTRVENLEVGRHEDVLHVDLCYPGVNGNASAIELNLQHVRANDGLRLDFDFDRNGWRILQPVGTHWHDGDEEDGWQEVFFANGYALKKWEERP